MPNDNENLALVLTVDPDTKAVEEALQKMGNLLDENVDIASKEMLKALDSQRNELEKINRLMDPKMIRERIRLEQELLNARKAMAAAEEEERSQYSAVPMASQVPEAQDALKLIQEKIDLEMKNLEIKRWQTLEEAKARKERLLDVRELRDRISQERELSRINEEVSKAEEEERKRQKYKEMSEEMEDFFSGKGLKAGGHFEKFTKDMAKNGAQTGQLAMAGQMVGGALGGPIGAEIGEIVAKMLPQIFNGLTGSVAKGLGLVSNSLSGLQQQLGPIGVGFDLVSGFFENMGEKLKAIPIIGEALGPMMDSLAAIPKLMKDITNTLTSMAGVASPGQLEMFNQAVRDVQGVIGHSFLPVLELMRDGVRMVGEVIANIIPNWQEVRGVLLGLQGSFAAFRDEMRDLLQVIGPIVRTFLIGALRALTLVLQGMAQAATYAVRGLNMLLDPLREMGLVSPLRTSLGMASRPASLSSIDEYQRQLQLAAAQEPGLPTASDVPNMVGQIRDAINVIRDWTNILTPDNIASALRRIPGSALESSAAALEAAGVPTISDSTADTIANWLRANGIID